MMQTFALVLSMFAAQEVATIGGRNYPRNQFVLEPPDACPTNHHHAANGSFVTALDGTTLGESGSCGYGLLTFSLLSAMASPTSSPSSFPTSPDLLSDPTDLFLNGLFSLGQQPGSGVTLDGRPLPPGVRLDPADKGYAVSVFGGILVYPFGKDYYFLPDASLPVSLRPPTGSPAVMSGITDGLLAGKAPAGASATSPLGLERGS